MGNILKLIESGELGGVVMVSRRWGLLVTYEYCIIFFVHVRFQSLLHALLLARWPLEKLQESSND